MELEEFEDIFLDDEGDAYDDEDSEQDESEYLEMLEGLTEADLEDLTERKKRAARRRSSKKKRRPVKTAQGKSAYRTPVKGNYVTQKQFKDTLGRVGGDVRRNALGIKTVNGRVAKIDTRVDGVVSVNTVQSKKIGQLDRQMRLDGALEIAQSLPILPDENNQLVLQPNLGRLLQGAVKSGLLSETKGALASPAVLGGLGFLLSNPSILGNVLGAKK